MRSYLCPLFVASMILAPAAALAQRVQLTDHAQTGCVMFAPSPSAVGSLVVFEGTCDLTGGNADGNREIFQVDIAGTVTQLTDTGGCANANASSNDSGSAVAFDSDCDFDFDGDGTGDGDNADASVEIFVWTPAGITQLTDASLCASSEPSINAAGTHVAFHSDCDHVAGVNDDRSNEIFRSTTTGSITQLTDDSAGAGCGSFSASSDASGGLIAFESDCDLTGGNENEVSEIFQVTGAGVVTQLTAAADDTCLSTSPASDSDGSVVAFASDCDYTGTNGDAVVEIFTVTSTGAVTQLTDDDSGNACESSAPAISQDGSVVAFMSFCDLTGANGDGSFEVLTADDGAVAQLTDGIGCSSVAPAVRSAADIVVWISDCDLVAANADGSDEVFIDSPCACGAPMSRYQSVTEPLASDALFTLRAAVGVGACRLCDCDVSADVKVTASDALLILKRAVGQDVALNCG